MLAELKSAGKSARQMACHEHASDGRSRAVSLNCCPGEIEGHTRGAKKTGSFRAAVPGMHLRIAQAHAAVERGAMLIIALLRSGLTGPQKWIAEAVV
jgi:hypothetical protein